MSGAVDLRDKRTGQIVGRFPNRMMAEFDLRFVRGECAVVPAKGRQG